MAWFARVCIGFTSWRTVPLLFSSWLACIGALDRDAQKPFCYASLTPTVSPAKSSLVYFISIAYIDHPVWRSQREEAKRGPPSGHRIPRNEGARMALLLP